MFIKKNKYRLSDGYNYHIYFNYDYTFPKNNKLKFFRGLQTYPRLGYRYVTYQQAKLDLDYYLSFLSKYKKGDIVIE